MSHIPSDEEIEVDDLNDLVSEALPPEVQEQAIPVELSKLSPWHRPRKQKVREHQWMGLASAYLKRMIAKGFVTPEVIQIAGTDVLVPPEIRYLTLPGVDYLDVRLLGDVCRGLNCRLTSLGFLDGAAQTRVLARARVREVGLIQGGFITDRSLTIPRKLESICGANGESLADLRRRAPFHIVNIDACGSIAPRDAQHSSRLVEAVHRLVELQVARASHRWLFFFTVDVREGDMNAETFDNLCDAIRLNAAESADFAAAAIELFQPGGGNLEDAMRQARASQARATLDLFSLGFSKWLLHLAQAKQWSVKLRKSHCYSTWGGKQAPPTMCSLAFEFIPPPPGLVDPLGVSRQVPLVGGMEEDPSMQIVTEAAAIDNLDEIFASDVELTLAMNAKTRALLLEAGYEEEALRSLLPQETAAGSMPRRFPDVEVEPA